MKLTTNRLATVVLGLGLLTTACGAGDDVTAPPPPPEIADLSEDTLPPDTLPPDDGCPFVAGGGWGGSACGPLTISLPNPDGTERELQAEFVPVGNLDGYFEEEAETAAELAEALVQPLEDDPHRGLVDSFRATDYDNCELDITPRVSTDELAVIQWSSTCDAEPVQVIPGGVALPDRYIGACVPGERCVQSNDHAALVVVLRDGQFLVAGSRYAVDASDVGRGLEYTDDRNPPQMYLGGPATTPGEEWRIQETDDEAEDRVAEDLQAIADLLDAQEPPVEGLT